MNKIIKDVLSCKHLRDGVKQALCAILVAILERIIISLQGANKEVYYIDS